MKKFKSVNIWQSYKQDRSCLMHFAHLANTLLKDKESARVVMSLWPRFLAHSVQWNKVFMGVN